MEEHKRAFVAETPQFSGCKETPPQAEDTHMIDKTHTHTHRPTHQGQRIELCPLSSAHTDTQSRTTQRSRDKGLAIEIT